jgi:hypothetical protein
VRQTRHGRDRTREHAAQRAATGKARRRHPFDQSIEPIRVQLVPPRKAEPATHEREARDQAMAETNPKGVIIDEQQEPITPKSLVI